MGGSLLQIRPGLTADVLKFAVPKVPEDRVGFLVLEERHLRDVVVHVAARDQEILPSVVIEIRNTVRPSRHLARCAAQAAEAGDLRETARARVSEQLK